MNSFVENKINKHMVCSTCKKSKKSTDFNICRSNSSGFQSRCKPCDKERIQNYRKTINGFVTHLYSTQKINSLKRKNNPPTYSKKEFHNWIINQSNFSFLFNNWKDSGYEKNLAPSVDRISDYKGYSLNNIQLMTWDDNRAKYNNDKRLGINTKNSKTVLQFDLNGKLINEYYSSGNAARSVGGVYTTICQACRGKIKTSMGFIWKYKDEN